MTVFVAIVFALTYFGMALGRLPGLKIERSGIAMVAGVLLVAGGAVRPEAVAGTIHFPTLLLLAGLMILSARFGAAGFYAAAAAWIARQAARPIMLLALTIAVAGALSALLVNDIVVFAMTPLFCTGLRARGLDARPFLAALAASSNAGSAATLIGNPQNILIGQVGGLGFWAYLASAAVPAVAALILTFVLVAWLWQEELSRVDAPSERIVLPPVDRVQTVLCVAALAALLALFASPLPREISALIVAALLLISRTVPSRQILDEIDLPLLILFAGLFIVTSAFVETGLAEGGVRQLAAHGLWPDRASRLAPIALLLSNTIGNVPAVVLILKVWQNVPNGTLTALAVLSTLAGNLFLVGSLANLIVAERAAAVGVRLGFRDHARAGVPITLASMLAAALWLWLGGFMPL